MATRIFLSVGLLVVLIVLSFGHHSLSNLEKMSNLQYEFSTSDEINTLKLASENYLTKIQGMAQTLVSFTAKGLPRLVPDRTAAGRYLVSSGRIVAWPSAAVVSEIQFNTDCSKSEKRKIGKWLAQLDSSKPGKSGLRSVPGSNSEFDNRCLEVAVPINFSEISRSGGRKPNQNFWLILVLSNESLKVISRSTKFSYVTFYGADGLPLARSATSREDSMYNEIQSKEVRRFQKSNVAEGPVKTIPSLMGNTLFTTMADISDVGMLTMVATFKPNSFSASVQEAKREVILFGILFLLISLLIAFGIAKAFSTPIQKISAATKQIAQGDFAIRVRVLGVNEITTLAGSVNELTDQIENLMHQQRDLGRLSAEIETAQLVQETLFPSRQIQIGKTLRAASFSAMASECGGDLWGSFELPKNRFCLYIGDASGHGVPSAFTTIAAHSTFSLLQMIIQDHANAGHWGPSEILRYVNAAVARIGGGNILMSMFIAIFDENLGTIEYANAGHTKPILLTVSKNTPKKSDCTSLLISGSPLGFSTDITEWPVEKRSFEFSDKIVLFTDGLTENVQHLPNKITKRTLLRLLENSGCDPAPTICSALENQYKSVLGEINAKDDCTLVVLERIAA